MGWLSDGQMAALHRNFQGLFQGAWRGLESEATTDKSYNERYNSKLRDLRG